MSLNPYIGSFTKKVLISITLFIALSFPIIVSFILISFMLFIPSVTVIGVSAIKQLPAPVATLLPKVYGLTSVILIL